MCVWLGSLEQTKSAILPELVELTNDEESYVRLAGLETVVNILTLLDDGQSGHRLSSKEKHQASSLLIIVAEVNVKSLLHI